MDYFKLGEITGKAWRLGHMGAGIQEVVRAEDEAADQFKVSDADLQTFHDGFYAGLEEVDAEAALVHETSPTTPSDASEH